MTKMIVNKHTLKLAERQRDIAYEKCYITIMGVLESLRDGKGGRERFQIEQLINETKKKYYAK